MTFRDSHRYCFGGTAENLMPETRAWRMGITHSAWLYLVFNSLTCLTHNVGIAMPQITNEIDGWVYTTHKNGDFYGGWCQWHCCTNINQVDQHVIYEAGRNELGLEAVALPRLT